MNLGFSLLFCLLEQMSYVGSFGEHSFFMVLAITLLQPPSPKSYDADKVCREGQLLLNK